MGIIRTVVGLAAEAATSASSTRTQQTRASPPSTRQTPRYHDSYQPEIPPPNYPSAAYPQPATPPTTCYTYPEHVQPTSTPSQYVPTYYSQPSSSPQYQPAPEYSPPAPAYYYSQAAPSAFESGHSTDKHTREQSISSDNSAKTGSTKETSRLSRLFYKVRDFGPFIVVALVQPQSTTWAMVAGTGLVAAILAIDLYRWAVRHTIPTWPRIMLVAQLAAYAALLVLALSGPDTKDIANNYTMVVVNGTQAAAAFLSILLGFPFARQIAMESTPRTVWPTAGFKKLTLVLSLLWACVFGAMAGASAVIPAVGVANMSKGVHTLCNVAPIVLLVVGLKASRAISNKAKAQASTQAVRV